MDWKGWCGKKMGSPHFEPKVLVLIETAVMNCALCDSKWSSDSRKLIGKFQMNKRTVKVGMLF